MKKILLVAAGLVCAGAIAATTTTASTVPVFDDESATSIVMERPETAKKCAGCHTKPLTGRPNKAPSIAGEANAKLLAAMGHGIPAEEVEANLKANGGKIPDKMKSIVTKLTDAQKAALATWIAACPAEGCPEE